MPDIFDQLSSSNKESILDIFDQLSSKSRPKEKESVGRLSAQAIKGLGTGKIFSKITSKTGGIPAAILELNPQISKGYAQSQFSEEQEQEEFLNQVLKQAGQQPSPSLNREVYMKGVEEAAEDIPTPTKAFRKGVDFFAEQMGIDPNPKTALDKTVNFVGEILGFSGKGNIPAKVMQGFKGEIVRELMQQMGLPEWASDALGFSYAFHERTPEIKTTKEKKSPEITVENPSPEGPSNNLPSGLSKPRALEVENKGFATIHPARQKIAIKKLNQEASELFKKSVEKHLPLSKQIEEGFDFEGKFKENFSKLRESMEKYDPEIDITPITDFLRKTSSKYRGIPTPHGDAVKIIREVKNFRNKPQTGGKNLLRIYRSNNKKLQDIFETSMVTGKQEEYVDFLLKMNRSISDSFIETLPQDSKWSKEFLSNNKIYKTYINSQKTLGLLKNVLEGEITPGKINRIAQDQKTQRKLELSMGKNGASEIIQIAKDLKLATESIKGIPTKKMNAFDSIFPVGLLIPYLKIPVGVYKGIQYSRNLYGHWLSNPSTRKSMDKAIKAIHEGDLVSYKEATEKLKPEEL